MKTDVKRLEAENKAEITVEIPADEVEAAVDAEYRELASTVKIPGFRQGKVPRKVLERHLGPETVSKGVAQKLVEMSYPRALDDADIFPVDAPAIRIDDVKEGQPLKFVATIPVEPTATVDGYIGLEVTVPPATAKEEEIVQQIDNLRERFAKLEVVEGRSIDPGDFALIDFTGYLDDVEFEGGSGTDFLLEIGSGRFLPGFEEGLVGVKTGETADLQLDVPGDYHGTHIAGKRVRFSVTVKEIKAKVLPEADDDLAAEASEYDTLAELRASIRGQVEDAKRRAVAVRGQSQILDRLEANVVVETPQTMVDLKHDQLLKQFVDMLQQQGLTPEQYFQITGSNAEILRESMERESLKRVREELALDTVARKEGIVATDADVADEFDALAARFDDDPAAVRSRAEERGQMAEVRRSVVRRKTLEWLMERAKVTEKEDIAEEGAADAESSDAEQAPAVEGTPSAEDDASAREETEDDAAEG